MPRETYVKLERDVVERLVYLGYNETVAKQFWRFYRSDMTRGMISNQGFVGTVLTRDRTKLEISECFPQHITADFSEHKIRMSLEEVVDLLGVGIVSRIIAYQRQQQEIERKYWGTLLKSSALYERNDPAGEYEVVYTGPRLAD